MAAQRLVLLLMMMTATNAVSESSTTVTDRELAKVVVEKTSQFLEGPTGRALTIQDRFQGWINSLENQISELAYNAVNRATSAISRIPFFETYFSQYQSPLSSLQREPPKIPPVLYIYPQSQQYRYNEDVDPSAHDAIEQSASHNLQQDEQNILDPDATDDYQDYEEEASLLSKVISPQLSSHSPEPNSQAREHYFQSQDSSPHNREHYPQGQKHYLQSPEQKLQAREPNSKQEDNFLQTQEPSPHAREHYLHGQEPNPQQQMNYPQGQEPDHYPQEHYPQSQEQYLAAQQKQQTSVQLQGFPQPIILNPIVKESVVSSGQPSPYIPLLPLVPRPLQVKSDVASPLQVLANGQTNEGSVNEAIKRVFSEDGGGPPSVQRQGAIEQPNVAGDESYRDGPYYPDAVEGGFTLAPAGRYLPKSPLRSDKDGNSSTKPTYAQNLQKFTPDQYSPPLSAYNPLTPVNANLPVPLLPADYPFQPYAETSPKQPLSANNNLPLPSYRPTPRHADRTEVTAPKDLVNANGSSVNPTENLVTAAGQSRRRRSAWERFSIWNLFTDDSSPTALYCPSGGGKLLLCAGDQLFDEYVKAPIESAKDWVTNIDLHLYD